MAFKKRDTQEFGDFQTPLNLAYDVCSLLSTLGVAPASVLEPTCGEGNFVLAALQTFPSLRKIVGIDIKPQHVAKARSTLTNQYPQVELTFRHGDFFDVDWEPVLETLPEPLLILGNPPWVTNASLGAFGGSNLPKKVNMGDRRGIEAITGKSNFDISEWMLMRALDWMSGKQATMAVLCKTSVARKVLAHAWKEGHGIAQADIYPISAKADFGAAVDACLLVVAESNLTQPLRCRIHDSVKGNSVTGVFGYHDGRLLSDIEAYESLRHLDGHGSHKWRSGIKHDCTKVMEFRELNGQYQNGLGEVVSLESDFLYPMVKASDVAGTRELPRSKFMLVTQRSVREKTETIRDHAPNTWEYLQQHAWFLDNRASSIYRNRPRFSLFGVGDYSFAPWKVAISGFHKNLHFRAIGPSSCKPVVLDDTCYFLPCKTYEHASILVEMLDSSIARTFYSAFLFRDSKRPVTADLLQRLELEALAEELGIKDKWTAHWPRSSHQPRFDTM
jgi:hypothetical protein